MGNSQSKQTEVDVPRRSQNRLSKPRTITSTSNVLNAPSAASRRDSLPVVPLAVLNEHDDFVPLDNSIAESGIVSRRNSLSTRQRLRDHLFRSKSSDGRSRITSVATREEVARDAVVGRWPHSRMSLTQCRGDENLPEFERSVNTCFSVQSAC